MDKEELLFDTMKCLDCTKENLKEDLIELRNLHYSYLNSHISPDTLVKNHKVICNRLSTIIKSLTYNYNEVKRSFNKLDNRVTKILKS